VPPTGADAPLLGVNIWSARDAGHMLEVLTRLFLLPTATASSASLPSPRDLSSTKHLGNQGGVGSVQIYFVGVIVEEDDHKATAAGTA